MVTLITTVSKIMMGLQAADIEQETLTTLHFL
jgi:hypothetical protein